jgi:hypothetical protein
MKIEINISKRSYQKLQKLIREWPAEDQVTVEQLLEGELRNIDMFIEALELENW